MSWRTTLLAAAGLALVAGCGRPSGPRPEMLDEPPRSASDFERLLRARTDSYFSLRADLELEWRDPAVEAEENWRGWVSYAEPSSFRLRGTSKAFFTVFDIVATADDIRLDVPHEEIVVFGDRRDPGWSMLPLSPARILGALLADPCPQDHCLASASVIDETNGRTRLVWGDEELEVLTATGLPTRWASGEFEVRWEEWYVRGGRSWPGEIVLADSTGARLAVRVGRIRVHEQLPRSRFFHEIPQSREVLTPADAARRWSRLRRALAGTH
jgi:hypothetical protein